MARLMAVISVKPDDVACILGLLRKRGESGYHVPEYVRT